MKSLFILLLVQNHIVGFGQGSPRLGRHVGIVKHVNVALHLLIVEYTSIHLTYSARIISNLSWKQCQVISLQARLVGMSKAGLEGADISHARGPMAALREKKLLGTRFRFPSGSLQIFNDPRKQNSAIC